MMFFACFLKTFTRRSGVFLWWLIRKLVFNSFFLFLNLESDNNLNSVGPKGVDFLLSISKVEVFMIQLNFNWIMKTPTLEKNKTSFRTSENVI